MWLIVSCLTSTSLANIPFFHGKIKLNQKGKKRDQSRWLCDRPMNCYFDCHKRPLIIHPCLFGTISSFFSICKKRGIHRYIIWIMKFFKHYAIIIHCTTLKFNSKTNFLAWTWVCPSINTEFISLYIQYVYNLMWPHHH